MQIFVSIIRFSQPYIPYLKATAYKLVNNFDKSVCEYQNTLNLIEIYTYKAIVEFVFLLFNLSLNSNKNSITSHLSRFDYFKKNELKFNSVPVLNKYYEKNNGFKGDDIPKVLQILHVLPFFIRFNSCNIVE